MEVVIYAEEVGDKYILCLEKWQIDDLRAAMVQLNNNRATSNRLIEKKRREKGQDPTVVPKKPRLVIGEQTYKMQPLQLKVVGK